jgi:NSS family neurotransmitter:Na+ symporter
VEGSSTAIADKFKLNKKKTTTVLCLIEGVLGLIFVTGAGLACLDIVDNFVNSYTLILTGIFEVIIVGWCFQTSKVLDQINLNTQKFKMPKWWFYLSIKFVAPVILTALFVWNVVSLFLGGGIYGAGDGYSLLSNIILGWLIMGLSLISGFIVKAIAKAKKTPEEEAGWDDIQE